MSDDVTIESINDKLNQFYKPDDYSYEFQQFITRSIIVMNTFTTTLFRQLPTEAQLGVVMALLIVKYSDKKEEHLYDFFMSMDHHYLSPLTAVIEHIVDHNGS